MIKNAEIIKISKHQEEVLRYAQSNLAPSTVRLYQSSFKNLIHFLGNIPIKQITSRQIEAYKAKRAETITKSTVNIELTCIKAAFNLAIKWGYLPASPAKDVSKFRIEEKEILYFTDSELKQVMKIIPPGNIRNIVLFAIYTGCRINEIVHIQLSDIDLLTWVIYIRNKTNFKTKSGRNRVLPVSDNLYSLLNPLVLAKQMQAGESEQYLFTNALDIRYNKDYVSKQFKKYLREAGLSEKFHFHVLRHTFITNLIKKGVNINYVKELAGHAELSTTMHYIHIVTNDLREAVNKINSVAA